MKSKIIFFLVTTILVGYASCASDEFPSSKISRCKFEDEHCLVTAWNSWMTVAAKSGIPELGIPVSDKHYVNKQEISLGSSVITLKIVWQNVTVRGMSNSTLEHVKGFKKDPKQMASFEISGFVPYLHVSGIYVGSGKLLLLQVSGTGLGEIHFYNTTFKITVFTKVDVKDGEEYLVPTKVRAQYQSDRHRFKFDNILNNKEISDSINNVVNENHELFAKEANKPAAESFSKVFKGILTPIFARYPYRSFFTDE